MEYPLSCGQDIGGLSTMKSNVAITDSIYLLYAWIKRERYLGWDPYDFSTLPILSEPFNKYLKIALVQIGVYFPINLRPMLNITKQISTKSLALLSQSFAKLYLSLRDPSFKVELKKTTKCLLNRKISTKTGYCWLADYYSPYISADTPDIVITTEAMKGLIEAYKIMKKNAFLVVIKKTMNCIISEFLGEFNGYYYLKYTPIQKEKIVPNVSGLGLSTMARYLEYIWDKRIVEIGNSIAEFLLSFQRKDGSWPYSYYLSTGKFYIQLDYHQGFIIDGLVEFLPYIEDENLRQKVLRAIEKGVAFYMNRQFSPEGWSYYRYPIKYPIDIHNQAQGIITFSKLYRAFNDPTYLNFAEKIAEWTIKNMQDPSGYFYAHKWPGFINKIPYMRWAQAWMMLALSTLIYSKNKYPFGGEQNDK